MYIRHGYVYFLKAKVSFLSSMLCWKHQFNIVIEQIDVQKFGSLDYH